MEHRTVKATTVATDLGQFTAVAAAWTVDRQGDQIIPGAFRRTIQRWQASGKLLPVHYNHRADADHIIGAVWPDKMTETEEGLVVEGDLDLEGSARAREVWRSMKNGVMSLSFGYAATDSVTRDDGVQELREIDLYEVSLVPHPANFDSRVLAMKSLDGDDYEELRAQARDDWHALLTIPVDPPDEETIRKEIAEFATKSRPPVQIASFDC